MLLFRLLFISLWLLFALTESNMASLSLKKKLSFGFGFVYKIKIIAIIKIRLCLELLSSAIHLSHIQSTSGNQYFGVQQFRLGLLRTACAFVSIMSVPRKKQTTIIVWHISTSATTRLKWRMDFLMFVRSRCHGYLLRNFGILLHRKRRIDPFYNSVYHRYPK